MSPLLSIIIPLYNTERYIDECLSSIIDSDIAECEYEIIVIDDGSTDYSPTIVKSYCVKHPNIFLFRQDNQGVSIARMNGISLAKGSYIWFIDSDDYLEPNALKKMLHIITEHPVDLIVNPLILQYENGLRVLYNSEHCQQEGDIMGKQFLQRTPVSICPPQFVFKKDLIKHPALYFPKEIRHEDEYFCRVLQYISTKAFISSTPLYVYRQWGGSYMKVSGIQSLYDMVSIYRHLDRFEKEYVESQDRAWFHKDIINFLLGTYAWHPYMFGNKDFSSFRTQYGSYIIGEFSKSLKLFSIKERILGMLLLLSPRLHRFLLDKRRKIK